MLQYIFISHKDWQIRIELTKFRLIHTMQEQRKLVICCLAISFFNRNQVPNSRKVYITKLQYGEHPPGGYEVGSKHIPLHLVFHQRQQRGCQSVSRLIA